MKRFLAFLLFIALFGLMGCSSEEEEMVNFFKEYKTKQYTIEDYENPPTPKEIAERVKPYLTEDELEQLKANNKFSVMPAIAENQRKNVAFNSVKFSDKKENEDGSVDFNYKLKLNVYNDHGSEPFTIVGEVTFIKKDGELKISRDRES